MKRTIIPIVARCAVLSAFLHCAAAQAQELSITMLPDATVDDTVVTLDQITRIIGGSAAQRKRLGKIDVADFPLSAERHFVTAEQVRFRLLLAGLEAAEFRLGGAKRTAVVEPDEPITLRRMLAAAAAAARMNYPGDAATATITPARGAMLPAIELRRGDRAYIDAAVSGPVPRDGRARVEAAIVVNGKKREVVPIFVDIAQPVADSSPLPRPANGAQPAGPADVLIKARDNVKIVAVIGPSRVEAMGEAQQDGKIGQVIRVRNLDSNRVVYGRVESSGVVTVEY